jgi:hypothetical protein
MTAGNETISGNQVLASGSVVLTDSGHYRRSVSYDGESITYEFIFRDDLEVKESNYRVRTIDPNNGEITLINFSRGFTLGFDEPFKIGALGHRYLLLNIAVIGFSKWKVLYYTFFLGEAI